MKYLFICCNMLPNQLHVQQGSELGSIQMFGCISVCESSESTQCHKELQNIAFQPKTNSENWV